MSDKQEFATLSLFGVRTVLHVRDWDSGEIMCSFEIEAAVEDAIEDINRGDGTYEFEPGDAGRLRAAANRFRRMADVIDSIADKSWKK